MNVTRVFYFSFLCLFFRKLEDSEEQARIEAIVALVSNQPAHLRVKISKSTVHKQFYL